MVLTSEKVLLFGQSLILSGKSQEIDIENRVLLGELNQTCLHALFREVRTKLLNKSLQLVNLGLLLMPVIGGISKFLAHILLNLVGSSLSLNVVFVELILNNKVIAEALV